MKRPAPDSPSASQPWRASRNGLVSMSAMIVSQRSTGNSCDGRDVLDAGAGHDHVEAAEALDRGGHRRRVGRRRRSGRPRGACPGPSGSGRRSTASTSYPSLDHARGHGAADPAGGAGDEGDVRARHPLSAVDPRKARASAHPTHCTRRLPAGQRGCLICVAYGYKIAYAQRCAESQRDLRGLAAFGRRRASQAGGLRRQGRVRRPARSTPCGWRRRRR